MIDQLYLNQLLTDAGFTPTQQQLEQFDTYAAFLVDYNQQVNLTAITDPKEIAIKHFLDSAMLLKAVELPQGISMVDVGTGAGFPSVPVKILREDIQLTLMDSLNKRIAFLSLLSEKLGQKNHCVHSRAEEAGRGAYREKFDVATARAVADLRVLAEYCLPMVKVGGCFVALKGYDCQQEVAEAKNAITQMGAVVERVERFVLPEENRRAVIVMRKTRETPAKYPRHGGKISKSPL